MNGFISGKRFLKSRSQQPNNRDLFLKKKQNKDSILLLRFNDNAVQTEEVQAHLVFH